jgi:lipopolysaccharide transport system ATP-binding protein
MGQCLSPSIAIQVENLSKRYRLGAFQGSYQTLRDTLTEVLAAPWRRLGSRGDSPRASQPLSRDSIWALKDVSLVIPEGEILGIIGRNGAGKTTLLKVLSRITEPTRGRVQLRGRVGSLLEVGTGFHHELTGRENIFLNGAILGMSRREIQSKFDEIVAFAEIEPFLDTPLKRYSTGMGTRLAFAIAAHLDTEILLVDEVLAVGDVGFRKKCLGKMQDVTQAGRTVLFVSHDLNSIRRLCQSAIWLDQGRIGAEGAVKEVVEKYEASFLSAEIRGNARVERDKPPHSQKYFSWASLSTPAGDPVTTFAYGDTLLLTLGMEGRSPAHSHFVEWFLTDLDRGNRVAWGASHALPGGDLPADAAEVAFEIGPLPLAVGRYTFSFAMGIPAVANLDFWHDAVRFEINRADFNGSGYHYTTGYAPVIIPYTHGHGKTRTPK